MTSRRHPVLPGAQQTSVNDTKRTVSPSWRLVGRRLFRLKWRRSGPPASVRLVDNLKEPPRRVATVDSISCFRCLHWTARDTSAHHTHARVHIKKKEERLKLSSLKSDHGGFMLEMAILVSVNQTMKWDDPRQAHGPMRARPLGNDQRNGVPWASASEAMTVALFLLQKYG